MSSRKAAAVEEEAPPTDDGSVEFDVEAHGAQSLHPEEPTEPAESQSEMPEDVAPVTGWTPEEATQLICAIFNFGMLIYGPEWAADPRETLGWNFHAAQLLDHILPKGTGGYVELGAGLIMVGNGLAMMGVRRIEIIQRGPRPMWVQRPKTAQEPGAPAPIPPAPAPPPSNGHYKLPAELTPSDTDPLTGIGL